MTFNISVLSLMQLWEKFTGQSPQRRYERHRPAPD
jgi:hypothetical protein